MERLSDFEHVHRMHKAARYEIGTLGMTSVELRLGRSIGEDDF